MNKNIRNLFNYSLCCGSKTKKIIQSDNDFFKSMFYFCTSCNKFCAKKIFYKTHIVFFISFNYKNYTISKQPHGIFEIHKNYSEIFSSSSIKETISYFKKIRKNMVFE